MKNDNIIINDLRSGRYDLLYAKLYRQLLVYADQCLTSRYEFLSEDCVQDAILKAYERRHRFETDSALRAFLYTSVHNNAIDILRKANARDRYVAFTNDTYDDSDNVIQEKDSIRQLFSAVKKLSDKLQTVFFDYLDEKTTREIAEETGLSVSAVKKRRSKMINELKVYMEEDSPLTDPSVFPRAEDIRSDPDHGSPMPDGKGPVGGHADRELGE